MEYARESRHGPSPTVGAGKDYTMSGMTDKSVDLEVILFFVVDGPVDGPVDGLVDRLSIGCNRCCPSDLPLRSIPPTALRLWAPPAYGRGWPGSSGQHRLRPGTYPLLPTPAGAVHTQTFNQHHPPPAPARTVHPQTVRSAPSSCVALVVYRFRTGRTMRNCRKPLLR